MCTTHEIVGCSGKVAYGAGTIGAESGNTRQFMPAGKMRRRAGARHCLSGMGAGRRFVAMEPWNGLATGDRPRWRAACKAVGIQEVAMAISTSTSSQLTSLFLQNQGSRAAAPLPSTSLASTLAASDSAASGQNSDPAYQVSIGQQANRKNLLGYGQLARLARQAGDTLGDVARAEGMDRRAIDGNGRTLVNSGVDTFGRDEVTKAASTLADAVNSLVKGAGQMTQADEKASSGSESQSESESQSQSEGPASTLGPALRDVIRRDFSGSGSFSRLGDIGISAGDDGTVAVDTAKLESAFASDPQGTRALLAKTANALREAVAGQDGDKAIGGQIASQMRRLTTSLAQSPSLLDLLNSSSDGSSDDGSSGDGATDGLSSPSIPASVAAMLPSTSAASTALASTVSSQAASSYAASSALARRVATSTSTSTAQSSSGLKVSI
jgi:hypothetical protein